MKSFKKFIKLIFLLLIVTSPTNIFGQIENLIVEKYYITDANDATDTTQGRSLTPGMVTYRIFLDLKDNSKLIRLYGDQYHPLIIESTGKIYNNIDRPNAHFGYLVTKSWFENNPTLALDSYLTLGLNTKFHLGVLKDDDTDGTFLGGINNNGGTAEVSGGLLVNNDAALGLPLTAVDGYMPFNDTLGQWFDFGFKNSTNTDTTVFGPVSLDSSLYCNDCFLQQNLGIKSLASAGNKILLGQITTDGDISFKLNVELEITDELSTKIVKYVADGDTLLVNEQLSPYLQYPPVCGCTDPAYLEFNPSYACNVIDSCQTLIKFGCQDTLACNFDFSANYHIHELCCYIGYCSDRNLTVVCPDLQSLRIGKIELYPNPAQIDLTFQLNAGNGEMIQYEIFNSLGLIIDKQQIGFASGIFNSNIDISGLNNGVYFLKVFTGDQADIKMFIKN